MPSHVLRETPYIVAAVQASKPAYIIEAASKNDLKDTIFVPGSGGFVGGMLLNVANAALSQMNRNPAAPLTEKTVEPGFEPQSYIAKLVISLINQSHNWPAADGIRSYHQADPHYCAYADLHFKNDATKDTFRLQGKVPEAVLDDNDRLVLYRKGSSQPTSLITRQGGITVNGITVPDGVIGYHRAKPSAPRTSHGNITQLSFSDVEAFSLGRVIVPAVPRSERTETFAPIREFNLSGLQLHTLAGFLTMDEMRIALQKKTQALVH